MSVELEIFIQACQQRVEKKLSHCLPSSNQNITLYDAMHYSVLNGGKRLRSVFIYAVGEVLGAKQESLDTAAAAIEIIHASSLIHDDLPCMDNDSLRRGKPSCHAKFEEATAVITGDSLIFLSIQLLANEPHLSYKTRIAMINILSEYSGCQGLIKGQAMDITMNEDNVSLHKLIDISALKTAKLFQASIILSILSAEKPHDALLEHLKVYAFHIGVAYQIHDDILDVNSTTDTLGKPAHSDIRNGKCTYISLLGLTKAKEMMETHYQEAMNSIERIPYDIPYIKELSHLLLHRSF